MEVSTGHMSEQCWYLLEPAWQRWEWWHYPEAQSWCQALECYWWGMWALGQTLHAVFSVYENDHTHAYQKNSY